ncbi:MAG: hypothetical protein ABFD12_11250 [Syntrophorhabdus sp.]
MAGKLRIFILILFTAITHLSLVSGDCRAACPPCPAVLDTTIAQMAAQWVMSYSKPYCTNLDDRRNMLLNHTIKPGTFYPSSIALRGFRVSDRPEDFAQYAEKALRHANLNKASTAEMAIAKIRVLKAGTALAVYAAGKRAFTLSRHVDAALEGFAPTSFDFASSRQTQKDAAKLAHLRGLIQAQELKLISLTKMLGSLKEGR